METLWGKKTVLSGNTLIKVVCVSVCVCVCVCVMLRVVLDGVWLLTNTYMHTHCVCPMMHLCLRRPTHGRYLVRG